MSFEWSLSLLAIHCLYRYAKITGKFAFLFDRWQGLLGITVAHFLIGFVYIFGCHLTMRPSPERNQISAKELSERYNVSSEGLGYLGPIYKLKNQSTGKSEFYVGNMAGSLVCGLVQIISYDVICYFGFKLYLFVQRALISAKTKSINMQLLRLLCIQAIAPMVFEYIPASLTIWGGFVAGFWGVPSTSEGVGGDVGDGVYGTRRKSRDDI
ncbi:unnamed protein product, partial [Mesorhabditis spiculigera]